MNTTVLQFLGAIELRASNCLGTTEKSFADFHAGNETRTPLELYNHILNVLSLFQSTITETERIRWQTKSLEEAEGELYFLLHQLNEFLGVNEVDDELMRILIQGPLSDVLSHIGQLAMLSRLYGKPVDRMNYMSFRPAIKPKRRKLATH